MSEEIPTLQEIWKSSKEHFDNDDKFHEEIRLWRLEMQPMLDAFKKNKVKKMVWEEETNTLYIYAKRITTIGLAIAGIWAFIKFVAINYLLK